MTSSEKRSAVRPANGAGFERMRVGAYDSDSNDYGRVMFRSGGRHLNKFIPGRGFIALIMSAFLLISVYFIILQVQDDNEALVVGDFGEASMDYCSIIDVDLNERSVYHVRVVSQGDEHTIIPGEIRFKANDGVPSLCFLPRRAGIHNATIREEFASRDIALADYPQKKCPYVGKEIVSVERVVGRATVKRLGRQCGYWTKHASHPDIPLVCIAYLNGFTWMEKTKTEGHCAPVSHSISSVQSCISRLGEVTFAGESTMRFLYTDIMYFCELSKTHKDKISYARIAGNVTDHTPPDLVETFERKTANKTAGALVFDTAALWFAAYGKLKDYEASIPKLLSVLKARSFTKIIWMSAPTVNPIVYMPELKNDSYKWAMTPPRVGLLNGIAKKHIDTYNKNALAGDTKIRVVHAWEISLGREDDSRTPTDMRHYGMSVMSAILGRTITALCEEE